MEKISTQIISKVKAMSITTIVFISVLGVQTLAAAVCLIVGWLNSSAAEFMGMTDELTVASILTGIVLNIFTVRILFHFLAVFSSAAKEGTPFTSENANRIKKIGVTILVASIIVPMTQRIFLTVLAPEAIASASDRIALPLVALAVVFIFFSIIFRYGTELQQQSDETL